MNTIPISAVKNDFCNSFSALPLIYQGKKLIDELIILINGFRFQNPDPNSPTRRTAQFIQVHDALSSSASLFDRDKAAEHVITNACNYVYGHDAGPRKAAALLVGSTPSFGVPESHVQHNAQNFNPTYYPSSVPFAPLPTPQPMPSLPPLPMFPPQPNHPVPPQPNHSLLTPPPALFRSHSSAHPPGSSLASVAGSGWDSSMPKESMTSHSAVGGYEYCTTFYGVNAKEDAFEYGLGPDYRYHNNVEKSVAPRGDKYKCNICGEFRLLITCLSAAVNDQEQARFSGTAVVGAQQVKLHHNGPCTDHSGSCWSLNKKGLPPSIHRYVISFLEGKIAAIGADLTEIRPADVANKVCEELQESRYLKEVAQREKIKKKVKTCVNEWKLRMKKEVVNDDKVPITIKTSSDLQAFVESQLAPCYDKPPMAPPTSLEDVNDQAASILGMTKQTGILLSNEFITLRVPDSSNISKLDKNGTLRKRLMVFSTLGLLYNAVISYKKHNSISIGSIDITHGICVNGSCLAAVGAIGNNEDGSSTFVPYSYCLLFTESELTATVTAAATNFAVKSLWGIEVRFKVGTIADHSDAFLNMFKSIYPDGVHGQCFTHFKMKFWSNNPDRKTVSNYAKKVKSNKPEWLWRTAGKDIDKIADAQNVPVMSTIWRLIKEKWYKAGEQLLADHVAKEYTEAESWQHLTRHSFNHETFLPNQNPTERHFLEIKGTQNITPVIECKVDFDSCVKTQMPRLARTMSARKAGSLKRIIPMADWSASELLRDRKTLILASSIQDEDLYREDDCNVYVNSRSNLGKAITADAIAEYKLALAGHYEGNFEGLDEYIAITKSFCHCRKKKDDRQVAGGTYWAGSCSYYQKFGRCSHVVRVAHSDEVIRRGEEIIISGTGLERKKKHRRGEVSKVATHAAERAAEKKKDRKRSKQREGADGCSESDRAAKQQGAAQLLGRLGRMPSVNNPPTLPMCDHHPHLTEPYACAVKICRPSTRMNLELPIGSTFRLLKCGQVKFLQPEGVPGAGTFVLDCCTGLVPARKNSAGSIVPVSAPVLCGTCFVPRQQTTMVNDKSCVYM